nr:glycosyltransferase [Clostridia bacterium]
MGCEISFVIPCYNSEKTITRVIDEIKASVTEKDYEIILINDGSKDNVYEVIRDLADKDKKIKVIDLIRNFGQHSALMTGLRYSEGDIVVCLDDDGQTPADEYEKLVKGVREGFDVVYAKYDNKQHSLFRNFGSKLNDIMACLMLNKPKDLYLSSYFACNRLVVDEIVKYQNPFPYLAGLVLRTTTRIKNVPVNHRKRETGESGYTLSKLIGLWMNGFTAFSVKPLRIATTIGFLIAILGFLYGIILIIRKITNNIEILGYSSIMASMLFIGGLVMIMLGLIGEYLGRIYICLNNQPQAIVRNTINIKKK